MKKLLLKVSLGVGVILVSLLWMTTAHTAAENPHLISKQTPQTGCTACHIETPSLKDDKTLNTKNLPVDATQFSQDGVAMCSPCHNPNQGHKVGLNIDFSVPADLPLSQENDITCLTCHFTHGSLESDRPQASVSFMDRLVNAERLHKSFLLRRSNMDGELCLTCHNVNQGPK